MQIRLDFPVFKAKFQSKVNILAKYQPGSWLPYNMKFIICIINFKFIKEFVIQIESLQIFFTRSYYSCLIIFNILMQSR